jgi:uncharacterized damage-inducible protein DinB
LNSVLKNHFDRLEEERVTLLTTLATLPEKTLSSSPAPGKWSVNQILIHLFTSEQLTLAYLKKKSLGIDRLKNSGMSEWMRITVLKWSQRIPVLKYRAPKYIVANTPEAVPIEELYRRWTSLRMEFRQFLDAIKDEDVHKLIYKHPIAGRFDVVQCLMFMREHYHHHLPQIKRLL